MNGSSTEENWTGSSNDTPNLAETSAGIRITVWRQDWVLAFHRVGSRGQTQVPRLGCRHVYSLSQFQDFLTVSSSLHRDTYWSLFPCASLVYSKPTFRVESSSGIVWILDAFMISQLSTLGNTSVENSRDMLWFCLKHRQTTHGP